MGKASCARLQGAYMMSALLKAPEAFIASPVTHVNHHYTKVFEPFGVSMLNDIVRVKWVNAKMTRGIRNQGSDGSLDE